MGKITAGFEPAVNSEGLVKLTFLRAVWETSKKKEEDGASKEYFKAYFETRGTNLAVSQELGTILDSQYTIDNKLGRTMTNMGFALPSVELVADEDGFMRMSVKYDEDGFEVKDDPLPDVVGFLKSCEGKAYVAKLSKNDKGYWEIDIDSLKPFVKAKKA